MTFDQAAFEREVGSQKFEKQALDEAIEKIRRKAKELLSDVILNFYLWFVTAKKCQKVTF